MQATKMTEAIMGILLRVREIAAAQVDAGKGAQQVDVGEAIAKAAVDGAAVAPVADRDALRAVLSDAGAWIVCALEQIEDDASKAAS